MHVDTQADVLLLSYEVEAAAERNAELSRRLNVTKDQLLSHSRPSPKHVVSKATQTVCSRNEDAKKALINLDDVLFDVCDMLSVLYPTTESTDMHAKRDLFLGRQPSLLAMSQMCLTEVRRLRCAWQAKEQRYIALLNDLKQSMHTQKAAAEAEKIALNLALQTSASDKLSVETQYRTLSSELQKLQSQCSALRDERDTLLQEKHEQTKERSACVAVQERLRAENAQLRFENTKLTLTLESLQKDWLLPRGEF